ncbi:hypothetical protein ATW79_07400 [Oenococcus oeni]|uniref:hypothetical protein n=1 Tax=Oenococcus oeni TaxID=1247 RepID=UPI0008F8F631|nr:hypothetical protein [Oenococcus oeni]OIK85888.1 hypothetical protein ATW79_07400 [Oenococcus oeni]OIL08266.1 hypothetical protein ATW92_07405 [Oenococcus oeni]OIL11206.1 hypothetical protein ATW93_10090 [Oenococcus oeni]
MSDDFLNEIKKGLERPIKNKKSIFQNRTEKTHPIQVRDSTYSQLKSISFKQQIKLVDLVDSMLKYALDSNKYKI